MYGLRLELMARVGLCLAERVGVSVLKETRMTVHTVFEVPYDG